jgi:L-aspartate oxidase
MMGGVMADLHGSTQLPRLFACGECADYGVHGANRLASNSLLDGLVFGERSAQAMAQVAPLPRMLEAAARQVPCRLVTTLDPAAKPLIQKITWDGIGIVRDAEALAHAEAELGRLLAQREQAETAELEALEAANMAQVAWLITAAALERRESRGAHYRSDYPKTLDEWRRHVVLRQSSGTLELYYQAVALEGQPNGSPTTAQAQPNGSAETA